MTTKIFLSGAAVLILASMAFAANGVWQDQGLPVCTATGNQENLHMVSDTAGGAILAWDDIRATPYTVYAQRVNAAGTPLWAANGLLIASRSVDQRNSRVAADGAGGAFIAWENRQASYWQIFVQRIDGSGTALWTANGVQASTHAATQFGAPKMVADGTGGVIVAWHITEGANGYDVWIQH